LALSSSEDSKEDILDAMPGLNYDRWVHYIPKCTFFLLKGQVRHVESKIDPVVIKK
jgi:hypothetical protein